MLSHFHLAFQAIRDLLLYTIKVKHPNSYTLNSTRILLDLGLQRPVANINVLGEAVNQFLLHRNTYMPLFNSSTKAKRGHE